MQQKKRSIKKNDVVMVVKGREKGKSGKVLRVLTEKNKAIVERLNFVKRHARPTQQLRQGGIIEKEAPLPIASLMLLCQKCSKPVRAGRRILEDGQKVRICKKCGDLFDK